MAACEIVPRTVLIEFRGRLVDYFSAPHPYREVGASPVLVPDACAVTA
jgi:hypothetical protein